MIRNERASATTNANASRPRKTPAGRRGTRTRPRLRRRVVRRAASDYVGDDAGARFGFAQGRGRRFCRGSSRSRRGSWTRRARTRRTVTSKRKKKKTKKTSLSPRLRSESAAKKRRPPEGFSLGLAREPGAICATGRRGGTPPPPRTGRGSPSPRRRRRGVAAAGTRTKKRPLRTRPRRRWRAKPRTSRTRRFARSPTRSRFAEPTEPTPLFPTEGLSFRVRVRVRTSRTSRTSSRLRFSSSASRPSRRRRACFWSRRGSTTRVVPTRTPSSTPT